MTARALAILLLTVFLAGCKFDNPLTSGPTKELNTWLLGAWETKNSDGDITRVTVIPMNGDRYNIWYRTPGKGKKVKVYNFEGWISRVGRSQFLSLKCISSPGDIPEGKFTFVHYQVIDQLHVLTRGLQLDAPNDASSFELRKEVRAKLKEKTLYSGETTSWTRVNDVYWDDNSEDPIEPLRNPMGYVEKKKDKKSN